MTATVKVLLSEPQEFYVSSDTISGKVVLTATDPFHWFTNLSVEMRCYEYCDTKALGKHSSCPFFLPAKEKFAAILEKSAVNGLNQMECEFTIPLSETYVQMCPPTFSSAASGNGISWWVEAKAQLEKAGSQSSTRALEDKHPIVFYPDDVSHPQVWGCLFEGLAVCGKENSDCICYLDYHLPQWPEKFTIGIKFNVPRIVKGKLEIYLQRTILAMSKLKAQATYEFYLLAEVSEVEICKAGETIEVSCQLKMRDPGAFTSAMFNVQYAARVSFESSTFNLNRSTSVDLVPPSPESRTSRRQLLSEGEKETRIELPPAYSS